MAPSPSSVNVRDPRESVHCLRIKTSIKFFFRIGLEASRMMSSPNFGITFSRRRNLRRRGFVHVLGAKVWVFLVENLPN